MSGKSASGGQIKERRQTLLDEFKSMKQVQVPQKSQDTTLSQQQDKIAIPTEPQQEAFAFS